jgi:hypothetical protein
LGGHQGWLRRRCFVEAGLRFFQATNPGEFLGAQWDAMYFIEAIDSAGNGTIWPDFRREPPYVFVKLQR